MYEGQYCSLRHHSLGIYGEDYGGFSMCGCMKDSVPDLFLKPHV